VTARPTDPVFIVGPPRSGTTVLQRALRQHPDLWGGPESHFLLPLLRALPEVHEYADREPADEFLVPTAGITLAELTGAVGHGVAMMMAGRSGGRRWIDHTPSYVLELPRLVEMFPACRLIFLVRDGRDATESALHVWWGADLTFDTATQMWVDHVRAGLDHLAGPDAERILPMRFEELVQDPEGQLARAYEFLGLERRALPASVATIRDEEPVHTSFPGERSLDKLAPRWTGWDRGQRRRFDEIAGDVLRELGYETDRSWLGGPPVSVVVRLAGSAGSALRTLESIAAHTSADLYDVVVVDDGADSEVSDLLAALDGDVRVVRAASAGATAAFDAGAAAATGEHLAFVDDGVVVTPGWLDALLAALDADPTLGAVAPLVSQSGSGREASCLAVRAAAFRDAGAFDGLLTRLADTGWGTQPSHVLVLAL
jgi:hypothetical protein